MARALLITGLRDIPLMLVHIGEAVESIRNEQQLRRVDCVAGVNGNELEVIDDRQRGYSGVRRVRDGRLNPVAVIYSRDDGRVLRDQNPRGGRLDIHSQEAR